MTVSLEEHCWGYCRGVEYRGWSFKVVVECEAAWIRVNTSKSEAMFSAKNCRLSPSRWELVAVPSKRLNISGCCSRVIRKSEMDGGVSCGENKNF